jgi:PAS domain S-box-containing protein
VKCNPAFEKLLGYTETELLALNFRDVTHPEDLTNDAHAYHALVAGECENYQIKKRYLRRDGQLVWARLTVSLVRGEHGEPRFAVGMVEDITERQRAAEALRASQESLRASIENTPNVAVQWYDLQGRVVFWNRASENIFGWTAAEALGKTLDEMLFTREQHEGFVAALQTIAANGQPIGPVEFPFRYRSGATGTLVSTVFQIPGPNGELRFVCMDVDITERKRAEAEREAAVAREQATRVTYTLQLVAAQEAERARIAGELHDSLGQELLLIKNRAQLALAGENIPADLRAQLTGIGELATQAIGEVRQISRDLHPHQLDHLGLTRALSAMIESSTRAAKIPCEQRIETVDDLFTKAAATNLYRIVQESLNNLLKHAHATHASVRLERDVHELQLTIEDNGVGFDVAAGEQSPSGLGLKNIATRVQMLGGKLEIISTPGQGTRVEVKLPIAEKPNAFGSGI